MAFVTHKTGSSTLATIFNRYALTHNLTVATRKTLSTHFAQTTRNWLKEYYPVPSNLDHFDMLTDHTCYNRTAVLQLLPKDSVFVSIVREPLSAFVSAFYYYRDVWHHDHLLEVPGSDPVKTYLSDMQRYDTFPGSETKNRILFDFGLDPAKGQDLDYVISELVNLTVEFHFVLLVERFDEGMVLLKRAFDWQLTDMLYVKMNTYTTSTKPAGLTEEDKKNFEARRLGEYAFYRHFAQIFESKVASQDASFLEEVQVFQRIRTSVDQFCSHTVSTARAKRDGEASTISKADDNNLNSWTSVNKSSSMLSDTGKKHGALQPQVIMMDSQPQLVVQGTQFSDGFRVSEKDCRLLMRGTSFVRDPWFEILMLERVGLRKAGVSPKKLNKT